MPTVMTLTEETKQALNNALDQSQSPEQLLTLLESVPFVPGQCTPHGCTGLAIEHLLTRSNTESPTKKGILLDLLSDPAKASSLITAMLA